MIKVGIAGATGYVGIELIRLLLNHPEIQLAYVATQSYVGQSLKKVYPHLHTIVDIECSILDPDQMAKQCDLIFTALPHGYTYNIASPILDAGKKLIDLGSDFRLKNIEDYKQWYGKSGPSPELLMQAVYGLPEVVNREEIKQAKLVANPGCYPTCTALGVMPALKANLVDIDQMVFDAKSGTSGAGRELALGSHFCEVSENFKAYAVAGVHRHTPEIEQTLSQLINKKTTIQFTPHLLPIVRGLLVTSYLKLQNSISEEEIWDLYHQAYKDEQFVRVCSLGDLPQTANVRGSNFCDIGLHLDKRTNRLIVISVIDNLIKGAAGQAIQNMNLMFGLPETLGLKQLFPTYP